MTSLFSMRALVWIAGAYGVLWLVTAIVGCPSVEASVIADMEHADRMEFELIVESLRSQGEVLTDAESEYDDGTCEIGARALAWAPFIICVDHW